MARSKKQNELLWTPSAAGTSPMDEYRRHINDRFSQTIRSTQELVHWSCNEPQTFWTDLYDYLELVPSLPKSIKQAYDPKAPISSNPPFFEGHKINYAENALFSNPDPEAIALIGLREGQSLDDAERMTWAEFREQVRLVASALRRSSVGVGDRVAALVATSNWAMVLFHATAAVGAIFTSISPDLGLEGCVSRLQQVTPKIVFADGDAVYKGKAVSTGEKLSSILDRLEPKPEVFVVPIVSEQRRYPTISDFIRRAKPNDPLTFTRVSFNDPLLICYSSGTTGAPKCIVHRHGLIIQLKKISRLHNGLTPKDVILQYSSTSWVVFYVMCGHYSLGCTTICYNGSPMYPDVKQLLRMAEKFKVTYFGTSPRYLLELEMSGCLPKQEFDLSSLRMVYTTGASMSAEQYRWFYHRAFPPKVQICNTAGGTDTATSLIAADPTSPIRAGEMQIRALGMDVDIVDPDSGLSIADTGEAGEMIIRKPFPSMPCFFWGDADNSIYKSSYFERFSDIDVWAQHDWLSRNPETGGFVMHGRSDGVLNPSGIRFGSSEIYALIETAPFTSHLSNTLCVSRRRPGDADEAVFLFVMPLPGHTLTPALRAQIKQTIRQALSPRHVPKFVISVPEIPVTINGKKVEIAVKKVISGGEVKLSSTVANPGCLEYFRRFVSLEREEEEGDVGLRAKL
ncbi:hypothetical protein B0A48_02192 [Cryoendolithus antarcticus]|uniref:AMP-dependent synthetase/ligase domain-containing protein n=1 Tax=Cryoendolithus antarcticus TaxID=1507870 RepID=A0A1V8TNA2_9PEZI|nr:hypothetical protein B0A48_02192 [Cryoendolithus antarcticus]